MTKKHLGLTFMAIFFAFSLSSQSEQKVEKTKESKTESSVESQNQEAIEKELKDRQKAKLEGIGRSAPLDIGLFSDQGNSVIGGGEGKLVLENGTVQLRMDQSDIQQFSTFSDTYTGTLFLNDQGGDVRIAGSQLVVPETGSISLNSNTDIIGGLGVTGTIDADAGLTVGDYTATPSDGTIRYNTDDFQGYKNGDWTSLSSPWEDSTNGISYNGVEIHSTINNGRIDFNSSSSVYQLSPEGATFTMRDDGTYKYGYYGSSDEVGPTSSNTLRLGSSTYRWMEIWSVNPLNTSSDKRLKKDIKPLEFGLDEILELNPVQYKWIDGHDKEMIGLIAQDVKPIIPNVVGHHVLTDEEILQIESAGGGRVVTEENRDSYSMSYSQLIPVLINSVKELHAEVEALRSELEDLKSKE